MIVADTNLIVYLTVRGVHTRQAERVYERDPAWIAPPLWRSEFRNTLALHRRTGALSAGEIFEIVEKAERMMRGKEVPVDSRDVLTLTFGSRCVAYDCEFVVLARDFGVPLVTNDRLVLSEFPETAVSIEAFAA